MFHKGNGTKDPEKEEMLSLTYVELEHSMPSMSVDSEDGNECHQNEWTCMLLILTVVTLSMIAVKEAEAATNLSAKDIRYITHKFFVAIFFLQNTFYKLKW